MLPGPPPKPTHLKALQGTIGGKSTVAAINPHEPIPDGDLHDPPDWMTAEQKAAWKYALDHAPAGLVKLLDRGIFTVWVVAESLHKDAAQKVAQFGMVTKSAIKGEPIQNPYLAIVNRQAEIMRAVAGELGFTPASRSRVSTGQGVSTAPVNSFAQHGRRPA